MTDLFLQPRESNRGCLVLGILGAACAALVAWLVLRGGKDEPNRAAPPAPAVHPEGAASSPSGETGAPPASGATTPATTAAELTGDLVHARSWMAQGDLAKARALARQLATGTQAPETRTAAERLLGEIHVRMAFSPVPMPEKQEYVIKSGDNLGAIARKFNTTVALIQKGNNLSGNLIRKGQKLSILPGPFRVKVDKSDFTLTVTHNGAFFKRYLIGTGKDDKTPEGTFKIVDKIAEPDWWRPDGKKIPYGSKENLLGTHWLALDARSYGIHGTWENETIGKPLSAGCVRMRNEEVGELFDLLTVGTQVEIVK